ncbi:leucine-rich repeat domain-containing protein [Flavobacterium sp.]|uniref:leucine-rich repeat domain-containing protein n=1 Tax=Flavobacterium sp. TaxID=239 RepID=UPI000ECA98F4|nr:leucine-rich repeat domain-containing protein [Flavobacterium sp.]HCQ14428.1 hypothetical protein [Flavobacterium sp.]
MKNKILLIASSLVLLLSTACSSDGDSDNSDAIVYTDKSCSKIVTIPDINFKSKLLMGYPHVSTHEGSSIIDKNGDGEIQVCEAEAISRITIDQSDINSIQGILEFRNVQNISFKSNNISAALDLTSLKRLKYVSLTNNNIPSLKVTGLSHLEYLFCDDNNLQTLSVKSLGSLKTLYCQSNQITDLNIEGATKLEVLHVNQNDISELEVRHISGLRQLIAQDNNLTHLDLHGLKQLLNVNCSTNKLISLDVSGCTGLWDVECGQNELTDLKLTGCTTLNYINCDINKLVNLDFTGLTNLVYVTCSSNKLVSVDFRDCVAMNYFNIDFNPNLTSMVVKNGSAAPQGISIYQCPSLTSICCDAIEQSEIMSDIQLYGYNCSVVTNCF